jgi:hypothetical protein
VTKPLLVPPGTSRLLLNSKASAGGGIRVGLLSATDGSRPLPGFELEASVPIEGDVYSAEVVWQEKGPDLSGLAMGATAVKLSFELRSAELYSYRFE